jgi:hypothetical protein
MNNITDLYVSKMLINEGLQSLCGQHTEAIKTGQQELADILFDQILKDEEQMKRLEVEISKMEEEL